MSVERKNLVWIALVIVLMMVGCGPSATQAPPTLAPTPVPPTETPEPTPVPPTQTPAPTATTEALPFPVDETFTKGGYTVKYNADGTQRTTSRFLDVSVVYTVTGNLIAVREDYAGCKDVVGTYTWVYDGEALTFTVVDDACTDRRNVAGFGRWLKKP